MDVFWYPGEMLAGSASSLDLAAASALTDLTPSQLDFGLVNQYVHSLSTVLRTLGLRRR